MTVRGRAALQAADPGLLAAYLALEQHLPRAREEYEQMLAELNAALADTLEALLGVSSRQASAAR
jgi:hypothetical protein